MNAWGTGDGEEELKGVLLGKGRWWKGNEKGRGGRAMSSFCFEGMVLNRIGLNTSTNTFTLMHFSSHLSFAFLPLSSPPLSSPNYPRRRE